MDDGLVIATRVRHNEDGMWVDLSDGRTLGLPLAWFLRLLGSSAEHREQVRISSRGSHWDALEKMLQSHVFSRDRAIKVQAERPLPRNKVRNLTSYRLLCLLDQPPLPVTVRPISSVI